MALLGTPVSNILRKHKNSRDKYFMNWPWRDLFSSVECFVNRFTSVSSSTLVLKIKTGNKNL